MTLTSCRRGLAPLAPRIASLACALAVASGCGGGDGATYRLDVPETEVAFQAVRNGIVPAPRTITIGYKGDGLLAGYPPDVSPPSWLSMGLQDLGPGRASLHLGVSYTSMATGTYRATVRLATGKADASEYVLRDLEVRLTIGEGIAAAGGPLAFQAEEGLAPPEQVLTLTTDLPDDRWSLAVEGGAGWVTLPATSGTFSGGTAQVRVGAGLEPCGLHQATLTVRDATGMVRARVPVAYQVDGRYTAPDTLRAAVDQGASLASLALPVPIAPRVDAATGAGHRWTLTSDQPWVTVSPASGDLSAPVAAVARLEPEGLWALANGRHRATLTLAFTQGGDLTRTIPLDLDLALAPTLSASPTATLTVDGLVGPGAGQGSLVVGTNLGEAFLGRGGWSASTLSPWLSLVGASGVGPGQVGLSLVPEVAGALPDGRHQATVQLQPTEARMAAAAATVTLALSPARVTGVTPHAGFVGQAGEVVLWGTGFGPGPTIPVDYGGVPVTGRVVGPAEVRVTAPARDAAGPVAISIPHAPAYARPAVERPILSLPGYTAFRAEVPSTTYAITLDPERQAVWLSGSAIGGFRRFAFADGAWTSATVDLPAAAALAVAADGRELIAVASGGGFDGSLRVERRDPVTLAVRSSEVTPVIYEYYGYVAPLADGRTLLIETDQWSRTRWTPGLASGPALDAWGPYSSLSRDGTRLVVLDSSTDMRLSTFDAGSAAFVKRNVPDFPRAALSLSADGGRMVAADRVYDRDFALLGALDVSPGSSPRTVISPDGRRGWVVHANPAFTDWLWGVADLEAASGPYTLAPFTPPITFPMGEYPRILTVSDDGSTLLVLTYKFGSYPNPDQAFLYVLPLP